MPALRTAVFLIVSNDISLLVALCSALTKYSAALSEPRRDGDSIVSAFRKKKVLAGNADCLSEPAKLCEWEVYINLTPPQWLFSVAKGNSAQHLSDATRRKEKIKVATTTTQARK